MKTVKPTTLKGKRIKSVSIKGHQTDCDSKNVLVLTMSDDSTYEIEGGYGGYTGRSCDEYIETIEIRRV